MRCLIMHGSWNFVRRSQLNSDTPFFRWMEWGIKIPLKAGHRQPNSKTLAGRWLLNMECWLGSFWFSRGSGPVLLKIPKGFRFSRVGSGPSAAPLWIRASYPKLNAQLSSNVSVRISGLSGVTVLCPWVKHINYSLVLVQPRKTRPDITEKLLTGMLRIKSNKIKKT